MDATPPTARRWREWGKATMHLPAGGANRTKGDKGDQGGLVLLTYLPVLLSSQLHPTQNDGVARGARSLVPRGRRRSCGVAPAREPGLYGGLAPPCLRAIGRNRNQKADGKGIPRAATLCNYPRRNNAPFRL